MLAPKFYKHEVKPKQKEKRIKVSLREKPQVKNDALVKNSKPKIEKALPMPKGNQLKELVKKPLKEYKPLPKPKPKKVKKKPKPTPIVKQKPQVKPLPPKKEHLKVDDIPDFLKKKEIEKPKKVVSENQDLYSLLSQDVSDQQPQEDKKTYNKNMITSDIKEMYGDEFGKLSEGEQKYILDNQEIMRRITQEVLNRVGAVNIPRDMRVNSENLIEFYLYPNGDISDIKFIKKSKFFLLDETTKETIQYAYSRYPRPKQKTLIRYKVGYYLQ
jgi:protein TonB